MNKLVTVNPPTKVPRMVFCKVPSKSHTETLSVTLSFLLFEFKIAFGFRLLEEVKAKGSKWDIGQ